MTDNQDFTMVAGDDKVLSITVTDDDGDPKDLTGAAITWVLAKSFGGAILITKTTDDDIAITDAAGGVFEVTLVPVDTANLEGRAYKHEAEILDSNSKTGTILRGTISILADTA